MEESDSLEEVARTDILDVFNTTLTDNWDKVILAVIIIGLALIVDRLVARFLKRLRQRAHVDLPSTSIFMNVVRIALWTFALTLLLRPVFGITPTALWTALGAGGLALSLGLQPTIANLISGLQLTTGNIIEPGEHLQIDGVTGTVTDITWRQTTIMTRLGESIIIPNSIMNTSAIHKLPDSIEAFIGVPIRLKRDADLDAVGKDIEKSVRSAMPDALVPGSSIDLKVTRITEYAIECEIWASVRQVGSYSTMKDLVFRAVMDKPYLLTADEMFSEGTNVAIVRSDGGAAE